MLKIDNLDREVTNELDTMHRQHLKHVEAFPKRKRLFSVSYISLNILMFFLEYLFFLFFPSVYVRLLISFLGLGIFMIDIYIIIVLYKIRLSRMIWQNSINKRNVMRTLAIFFLIVMFARSI